MKIWFENPEAQIHTVTALDAAQRLAFQKLAFIANVVIDLAHSPKSNSQPMWPWTRPLLISRHFCLSLRHLRDGHYGGSKELGNAQISIRTQRHWVRVRLLARKNSRSSLLLQKILVRTGLSSTQRKPLINYGTLANPFQKIIFLLEFLKVVSYKYKR